MGEWWNKMHVLPRTQPGMSRVLSPLSPAPVKVSSQGAAPGPWPRPLPHAERKHWRGVQRNRLYPVKQPQARGSQVVVLSPPSRPYLRKQWRGGGWRLVAQILELGKGFWQLFLKP